MNVWCNIRQGNGNSYQQTMAYYNRKLFSRTPPHFNTWQPFGINTIEQKRQISIYIYYSVSDVTVHFAEDCFNKMLINYGVLSIIKKHTPIVHLFFSW